MKAPGVGDRTGFLVEPGQDWGVRKGREGGKHHSAPLCGWGVVGGQPFTHTPPRIPKKLLLLPSITLAQAERKAMAGTASALPWLPLLSPGDGTKHQRGENPVGIKKKQGGRRWKMPAPSP